MPYHTNVKAKMSVPKKKTVRKSISLKNREKLKEHGKHHTAKHIAMMKKEMRNGSSFSKAHAKAMKKVGK